MHAALEVLCRPISERQNDPRPSLVFQAVTGDGLRRSTSWPNPPRRARRNAFTELHKHVGILMMVIAAVHVVLGLIFFGDWLVDILRAGVGNLNWTTEALASFWFLIFAWPLFLLGYVTQWAYRRTGQVPRMLGPWLISVAVISGVFLPAQGLWLFIPVGVLALIAARHPGHHKKEGA